VMKKCGMLCEGTLRQYGRCNQGIVDLKIYSMIASDRK
jgi:RimJ/RimL family protein N-acetyltransferase